MNNKTVIESLSMDLLRAAVGYHKGSLAVARRFSQEALKREREIDEKKIKPYFKRVLREIKDTLNSESDKIAEDALTYSVLCKNYAKKFT